MKFSFNYFCIKKTNNNRTSTVCCSFLETNILQVLFLFLFCFLSENKTKQKKKYNREPCQILLRLTILELYLFIYLLWLEIFILFNTKKNQRWMNSIYLICTCVYVCVFCLQIGLGYWTYNNMLLSFDIAFKLNLKI